MIDSPLLDWSSVPHSAAALAVRGSEPLEVRNPATGEELAYLPTASDADIIEAIERAEQAWQKYPSRERREAWLSQIANLMREQREELGRIITLEHGKPLREAIAEVEYAASFFQFYSEHVHALAPRQLEETIKDHRWVVHARPAGVVALISPWNFPLAMMAKKLSAAIATGCAAVMRPSTKTPLSMLACATLLERVGILEGLVQLIICPAEVFADIVCKHPAVRVVSFTGSTRAGQKLAEGCAPYLKRLSLELGGNAPFIVFEDANLDAAVTALLANKFRATGQTCVCANRIYVQRPILDDFAKRLIDRLSTWKIGNGLEADTELGPLIDHQALEKVERHVRNAMDNGAELLFGGRAIHPQGCAAEAAFYMPTVLKHIQADMLCVHEETFGPVIPLLDFASEEQAVAAANHTPYGLAAYVFTRDSDRMDRVCTRLRFGHIGRNTGMGPTAEAPFGGMKHSGYGREGGIEGLHDFVEYQTITSLQ